MELMIRITDENGVSIATTYTSADSKQDLIDALRDEIDGAESGANGWLDGAFDEGV